MPFNVNKFLHNYNIEHSHEGKNCSPDWVNIKCPMCSDNTDHGGFNLLSKNGWYNCRRCGAHSFTKVISILTNENINRAYGIIKLYSSGTIGQISTNIKNRYQPLQKRKKLNLDHYNFKKLNNIHKKYLKKRGYKPNILESTWELLGSNNYGDYKYRIIAPIYLDGKLISFQGRDITGKNKLKYKACKKEDEVIHHKHALYGIDLVPDETVIVVEGIFDVFRIGPGSVCTFGIKYKTEQVLMLYERFKKVYILFDKEPEEAIIQAENLANDLSGLGTDVEILDLEYGDPGQLNYNEVEKLKEMIK